jgi:heme/copper-type cytochrome/quinol oxidase subunit 3
METDPKRIVREWNREIEAEIRRRDVRQENGRWKIVVWVVLEVLWFVALFAVLGLFERLQR